MTYEIYADTLFIVNFSMDFLSLFITGKLTHSSVRPIRLTISAVIGALYATLSVVFDSGDIYSRVMWFAAFIFCALTMCRISYSLGPKRLLPVFLAVNLGLGGLMSILFGAARRSGLVTDRSDGASPLMFLLFMLISGAVSLLYGRLRVFGGKRREVSSRITLLGETAEARLLCDSGNLLCDPISSKPVIILAPRIFGERLPVELRAGETDVGALSGSLCAKLRLIPAQGVTGSRLLVGIVPDEVLVDGNEVDAIIALADGSYDGCDGIIPEELI